MKDTMEMQETLDLVASDLVVGTDVYDVDGESVGSIERLVLDKRGGTVAYAVLSFGGFLGIGNKHYPLPWHRLHYDESLGGFRIDVTEDQIKGAPSYDESSTADWNAEARRIDEYYPVPGART